MTDALISSARSIVVGVLLTASAGPARAAEILARAGTAEVSVEEVRGMLATLSPADRATLAKDPALLSQFVRAHLTRKALLAEIGAKKFEQQPGVKTHLERSREQALMDLYLDSVSKPPESYPSDADLKAAYEANKASFEVPRQFRVAQIYVGVAKGADKATEDKAKKKLDEVTKKLKAKGADFAAIATSDSEDAGSAAKGGEIGWLTEAQLVAGIRATVTALAKEAVSEPVRLEDGWHVLKLLELRPAGPRPLAEVRDALVAQLRTAKARELRQAHVAKMLEQNPPAINELALSKVLEKGK